MPRTLLLAALAALAGFVVAFVLAAPPWGGVVEHDTGHQGFIGQPEPSPMPHVNSGPPVPIPQVVLPWPSLDQDLPRHQPPAPGRTPVQPHHRQHSGATT